MKISDGNVEKLLQSYTKQVENKKNGKTTLPGDKDTKSGSILQRNDSVTITGRGDGVKKAKDLCDECPEVRQALVNEIKEQLMSGEYKVSSKEVADKIMHRAIVDGTV